MGATHNFFEGLETLGWQIFQLRQICWESTNILALHCIFPVPSMSLILPASVSQRAGFGAFIVRSSSGFFLGEVDDASGFAPKYCCVSRRGGDLQGGVFDTRWDISGFRSQEFWVKMVNFDLYYFF
jgi:hypothetical protein